MDNIPSSQAKQSPSNISHYLAESVKAFSTMMKVPVTLVDSGGNIRGEWGEEHKICSHSHQYNNPSSDCSRNLLSSLDYASRLGEPYVFVCRSGLVKIAVALMKENKLAGGFLAGPIIMGSLRESNINKLLKEDAATDSDLPKLTLALQKVNAFSPEEVSYLSVMLNNCILSSVENARDYFIKNEQYQRQSKLSSEVRNYKKTHKTMAYPVELEDRVSQLVRSGDNQGAVDAADRFLDELYLLEAGDLNSMKVKIYSLCNLLLRGLPDWDRSSPGYIETESGNLDILADEQDYESMKRSACSILGDLAVKYARDYYHGSSEIVLETLKFINKHYREKVTLGDMAAYFHMSQSYLSVLFKQEMGKSFTEYLTGLRLGEAKKLLRETNLNLTDVAYQCGFEDQSYFSKVFHKVEGITPSRYRNQQRGSS